MFEAHRLGTSEPELQPDDLETLCQYDWPGNVRELQHVIERAIIIARGGPLRLELPGRSRPAPAAAQEAEVPHHNELDMNLDNLQAFEKEILVHHLKKKNWKIYGPGGAAESLAIKPTTLVSKMKKFGLKKPWKNTD